MKYRIVQSATALLATLAFAACSNNPGSPFRQPLTAAPIASVADAAVQAPAATPIPAAPYVLSAQSAGQFIDFTIYNLGSTDLEIKKEHFAILDQNSRDITPYDKASAVIDLPQPAFIKPSATLKGRAIFHKITSPAGRRLVFKPDGQGTFADIAPAMHQ